MKKTIKNYPNYSITDDGIVTNETTGLILKLQTTKKGYIELSLFKNGKGKAFFVHRLVAQAFITNPENKPQVNHINGIKNDNRSTNLEWCTASENIKKGYENGLLSQVGSKHSQAKFTDDDVVEIKKAYKKDPGKNKRQFCQYWADIFDVTPSAIAGIITNKNWKHIKI